MGEFRASLRSTTPSDKRSGTLTRPQGPRLATAERAASRREDRASSRRAERASQNSRRRSTARGPVRGRHDVDPSRHHAYSDTTVVYVDERPATARGIVFDPHVRVVHRPATAVVGSRPTTSSVATGVTRLRGGTSSASSSRRGHSADPILRRRSSSWSTTSSDYGGHEYIAKGGGGHGQSRTRAWAPKHALETRDRFAGWTGIDRSLQLCARTQLAYEDTGM